MKEITKDNFEEKYPKIIDDLQSCSFIAIDCEFSGLIQKPHSLFDSVDERYEKLRKGLENYTIIQFGLSTFNYHQKTNQFMANSYCFNLLPLSCFEKDTPLTFEVHSVQFLCKHGFDFNKMFYKGISYINEKDEEIVSRMIIDKSIPFEDLYHYIQSLCTKVSKWRLNAKKGEQMELTIDNYQKNIVHYLILQELRKHFSDVWATLNKNNIVTVKKVTEFEKDVLLSDEEEMKLKKQLTDSILGFSKVMKKLKHLKKPVVGHNLLLDLMMIYQQFYNSLPQSYKKFKKEISRIFPEVYDTKHLSYQLKNLLPLSQIWSSNSLSDLYTYFKTGKGTSIIMYMPIIIHKEQDFPENEQFHEGGFDSFCTGFIFIKIAYMFLRWNRVKKRFETQPLFLNSSWLFRGVSMMRNRINIPLAPIKYIELDGCDPVSSGLNLLYVENILGRPLDVLRIHNELSKYAMVDVKLLRKCCGLIATLNESQSDNIIELYKSNNEFYVCRYNPFRHSNWARVLQVGAVAASFVLIGLYSMRVICLNQ